uniref:Putative zinc finger protein n=1 Tax=Schistosoma mansoni TaxID=6183 RepID=A0A5K4ER13_SCHMA
MDNTNYRNETSNCGIVSATSTSEDDQLSLCCLCGQTFPSIKSLHIHINVVHEEVADSFDFHLTDGENDDSHSVTLGSRISLSSSSEEFISKPETPVVCPNCKKSFPGLTSLRVHIDSVHHGNRIPQCDYCMKKFSTLSYLRMHISTVHEANTRA